MGKKLVAVAITGLVTVGIPAVVGYISKKTTENLIYEFNGVKNQAEFYNKMMAMCEEINEEQFDQTVIL